MGAWIRIKDFSGWGDATYLWPRWLVLRAVGLVFVLIFAGILKEGQVLVGPKGLIPLSLFFQDLHVRLPSVVEAFLQAPSLFWAGTSAAMITLVAWMGMLAAIALVLNLWPRLALLGCWVALLSFVTTWGIFSGSQVDQLMLETALLCIPFAPAGYRPGLGAASPPRPIAVFIVRWLLFRVMFESGVAKLIAGDPRWWNGTAMDVLYETSPFPTILGYLDHQLPHGYHLFEMALTYAAEFLAPLLAVFAGRRGRWVAFWIWVIFQAGIQLTNNFGWLNTVSIALGVLLLDDQMLVAAAEKLRWLRLGQFLSKTTARGWPALALATAGAHGPPALARWRLTALRTALWAQFGLTLFFFATYFGMPVSGFPYALGRPLKFGLENFRAANPYTLYGGLLTARYAVEFEGSNDAGVTWRPYEYHYQPQRPDRMGPFIAPWYPRFEATLQIEATHQTPSPLYALVAQHLLQDDQAVIGLFRRNPFPGAPPTLIRMPVYQLTFTDATMRRATGNFWHKELQGEYLPMMSIDAAGRVQTADSPIAAVRLMAEQGNVAAQSNLGLRYAQGEDVARDEVEALVWFTLAARAGDEDAARNSAIAARRVGRVGAVAAQQRSDAIQAAINARKKSQ